MACDIRFSNYLATKSDSEHGIVKGRVYIVSDRLIGQDPQGACCRRERYASGDPDTPWFTAGVCATDQLDHCVASGGYWGGHEFVCGDQESIFQCTTWGQGFNVCCGLPAPLGCVPYLDQSVCEGLGGTTTFIEAEQGEDCSTPLVCEGIDPPAEYSACCIVTEGVNGLQVHDCVAPVSETGCDYLQGTWLFDIAPFAESCAEAEIDCRAIAPRGCCAGLTLCSELPPAQCADLGGVPGDHDEPTCDDIDCTEHWGACCNRIVGGCEETTQIDCCEFCIWHQGVACASVPWCL